MSRFRLKAGLIYIVVSLLVTSTFPCQADPRPPVKDVEITTAGPGAGGSSGAPLVEARPIEGASLETAVARATSEDAFLNARMELTAGRHLRQDASLAVAFEGKHGPDGREIEVVLVPFPDARRPDKKAGFVAVARSGSRTAASYCILERAVAPSEPGAVGLEIPIEEPGAEKTWMWVPEEGTDGSAASKAKTFFKCIMRSTAVGCSLCVARCVVSVMFFVECMKYCCSAAFAVAVISCAVEMMVE